MWFLNIWTWMFSTEDWKIFAFNVVWNERISGVGTFSLIDWTRKINNSYLLCKDVHFVLHFPQILYIILILNFLSSSLGIEKILYTCILKLGNWILKWMGNLMITATIIFPLTIPLRIFNSVLYPTLLSLGGNL